MPTAPAAPATPNTPTPADAATAYSRRLSWVSARATTFQVYLDTVTPPVARVPGYYAATSYVATLLPSTRYYWQIVAVNDGGTATGPIWSFTTPAATAVLIRLAGTTVAAPFASVSIHDGHNTAPNTARLTFRDTQPSGGEAIQVGLGTLDDADLIFGGEVQVDEQTYVGTVEASSEYPVSLIDHTFTINKRRPFGTWVNVSATTIGRYLVAAFAPGFTATGIQDGLPTVTITFDGQADFMSCMGSLAKAISTSTTTGRTEVTYAKDVILADRADSVNPPDPIDLTHPPLNDPSPLRFTTDLSQIRTRVYLKGHGEAVPTDLAAGETIVPIANASMFTPSGGLAVAGTTPGGAQSQVLNYAGVQLGGGGALVGPGAAASSAPAATASIGAGLSIGTYQYAYTDVTASGESLPSPLATVTTFILAAPSPAPPIVEDPTQGTAAFAVGDVVDIAYSYSTATASNDFTLEGDISAMSTYTAAQFSPGFTKPYVATLANSTNSLVKWIHWWSRINGGTWTLSGTRVNNVLGGTFAATVTSQFATSLPAANATYARVALTSVAIGASGTTARTIYRTVVSGSQLKLLTTLADNTTTTYTDSTADASLGANAPTSDTSGLTQPSGQVIAGSTTLLLAGAGAFQANGGWANCGNGQIVFRYTGISGNTLTGIPASGLGSITATIAYNSTVIALPALTGVNSYNGLPLAMAKGAAVHVWVQRDDLAAQAALGLLELDANGNPTDGIREYTITDERRSEASLIALGDADLAVFSRPIVKTVYYTRDTKSKSGASVSINLTRTVGTFDPAVFDPAVFGNVVTPWGDAGAFTIQSVDISFTGPQRPLYRVAASSVAFTLSDVLRRVSLRDSV